MTFAILMTLGLSACGAETNATTSEHKKADSLKYTTFLSYHDIQEHAQLSAQNLGDRVNFKAIKYAFIFDHFYIYDITPDGQCYMRTIERNRSSTMAKTECTEQVLDAIDPARLAAIRANNT